ncbi:MAG: phosphate ABC transporter ATP-binding protein PstB [Thaumarchaeota archaeon]|nr:phosphate ABC transporter ATP-binding protein PstB [Nitrososphaerota archaeon]
MVTENVNVYYGDVRAVKDISLKFPENSITALIGPSGCGKTTFLRCLNRMHDMTPGSRVEGRVTIDQTDLYDSSIDPIYHRRKVGMVFQKPNPFPTMSIYDNVVSGVRLNGVRDRAILDEIVEDCLKMAYLWDEVSGDLKKPAIELSGGQQQRLCIARALAIQPEVLLMDEPASALDPIATQKIEETIKDLSSEYCIIIVTHNMQQAIRCSDYTAFMYLGDLVEHGRTDDIFQNPRNELTAKYVEGQFG